MIHLGRRERRQDVVLRVLPALLGAHQEVLLQLRCPLQDCALLLRRDLPFDAPDGRVRALLVVLQVCPRNPDLVRHHRHRDLIRELLREVTLAVVDEVVDHPGHDLPNVALHARHPPRRERLVDERAVAHVVWWVRRQQRRRARAQVDAPQLRQLLVDGLRLLADQVRGPRGDGGRVGDRVVDDLGQQVMRAHHGHPQFGHEVNGRLLVKRLIERVRTLQRLGVHQVEIGNGHGNALQSPRGRGRVTLRILALSRIPGIVVLGAPGPYAFPPRGADHQEGLNLAGEA